MYPDASALEDVEFLVRSTNRLATLDALAGATRTRNQLREATGSSRVTMSRILGDLEDRGWAVRTDEGYEATPAGAAVARELRRLFGNLDAVGGLGSTLRWLPVGEFDFELSRLRDAAVLVPTDTDLTATVTRMARRVREAERVRNVATGISAPVVDAYLDAAAAGDRSLESVMHARVFGLVEDDPELAERLRAMVAADPITVRRYDGDAASVMLTICDDLVLFCGRSPDARAPEVLETDDDRVRTWAERYFERLRADAEPLEVGAFTP